MQDRFKFRVWNKKTKKMYEVRSISEYKGDVVRTVVEEYDENGTYSLKIFDDYECMSEACEFMQCTGLKDKYGKLIYEGDIVKDLIIPEHPYIVEWSKCGFSLKSTISNSFLKFNTTQQEVIGNIYENSELLSEVE